MYIIKPVFNKIYILVSVEIKQELFELHLSKEKHGSIKGKKIFNFSI